MNERVDAEALRVRYREKLTWVRSQVDGLGMPIDENILPLVMWLQLLGIVTDMSCEGHMSHGRRAPWVSFDLQKTPTLALSRLGTLLCTFYQTRQVPYDQMVIVSAAHKIGEIECAGAAFQSIMSEQEQAERLKRYQEEMSTFADFLGRCYFAQAEGEAEETLVWN